MMTKENTRTSVVVFALGQRSQAAEKNSKMSTSMRSGCASSLPHGKNVTHESKPSASLSMSNGQKVRKITIFPLSDRGTSLPPSAVAAPSMDKRFKLSTCAASDT